MWHYVQQLYFVLIIIQTFFAEYTRIHKRNKKNKVSDVKQVTSVMSGPTMIRSAKNRSRRLRYLRLAYLESYGIGRAAVYQWFKRNLISYDNPRTRRNIHRGGSAVLMKFRGSRGFCAP